MIVRIAVVGFILGISAHSLHSQTCKDMIYSHENQIDSRPIELREVKGKILDSSGTLVPKVCVGIFTEPEHKLLRYAQTDESGTFELDTTRLPEGEYRLVAQLPGFCPGNARIRNRPRSRQKKRLVVHMEVRGIDTCSYVGLTKK